MCVKRNTMGGLLRNPVKLKAEERITLHPLGGKAFSIPLTLRSVMIHSPGLLDVTDSEIKGAQEGTPANGGHWKSVIVQDDCLIVRDDAKMFRQGADYLEKRLGQVVGL